MSGARANYETLARGSLSYQGAPRAQMFKRDHGKVVDMDTMMKLRRYKAVIDQLKPGLWLVKLELVS